MSTTNKKAYVYQMKLVPANILAIVIFIIMGIITIKIFGYIGIFEKPFIITLMLLWFALHEAFHGLGYLLDGCKLKNISYGIMLEKGIFYCMAYQELSKRNILVSLQMPFMMIGVITYVISIIFHLPILAWLSVFNIMGASMDLVMFYTISRIKNLTYSESGQPDEFVLITTEDLEKKKNPFLKLKEVKDYHKEDYQFKDFPKFRCSKTSYISIGILIALELCGFLLG